MIVVTGATSLARKLALAGRNGPEAVVTTLYQQAERILTVSKMDYVPVDTGALRASGFVEPPIVQGPRVSVDLGFGGPAAPYAVLVHENLTAHHPVGQAKYLEIPFLAATRGMGAVIARRVSDAIRFSFQRLGRIERQVRRAAAG